MLEELYIENLAVIEKACIRFEDALHVFTGETGAGKSILIHGIQAVLGQRVSKDWVRTGCERAVVTALFTNLPENVLHLLAQLDIPCEEQQVTLTREIRSDGRSVGRINGRTAAITNLKEIGVLLIAIHGQHDNQILLDPANHLHVLDAFGGNPSFLDAYQEAFRKLQHIARELNMIKRQNQEAQQKKLLFQKQIQEIGALHPEQNEEEYLENALIQAEHAEKIIRDLSGSAEALRGDGVLYQIQHVMQVLSEIEELCPDVSPLLQRLQTCEIELLDISQDLQHQAGHVSVDEERIQQMRQRYQAIAQVKKQFFCEFEELEKIYQNACQEIDLLAEYSGKIAQLEEEKTHLLAELTEKAHALSCYREETGKRFAACVTEELKFLNMPDVVLTVQQEKGNLTIHGRDSVVFLISANKGEAPKPISKIASGGELSRIMLALKAVIADRDAVPTLIFDEIDTGVSGKAAQKIGIKLREISRSRQVLCVTHLSQIAVMADTHYMIEKHAVQNRTVTQVHLLDFAGRVQEIARIMSGDNPSSLMLRNAEEELKQFAGQEG